MTHIQQSQLRRVLLLDAATCAVMALVLLLAGSPLAALLELPARLLHYAGLLLVPTAAFMAITGTKWLSFAPAVWTVIAGNGLWVLASIMLLAGLWISPNALGFAFIAIQAAVVTALAYAELKLARSPLWAT